MTSQFGHLDQTKIKIKTEAKRDPGQVNYIRDQVVNISEQEVFSQGIGMPANMPFSADTKSGDQRTPPMPTSTEPGGGNNRSRFEVGKTVASRNPFDR